MDKKRFNPDEALVPVIGFSRDDILLNSPPHQHQRSQLYYCSQGTIKVRVNEDEWLAAPQRAVWIPGGTVHHSRSHYPVGLRTLYFDSVLSLHLPESVCILEVSILLRELIEACVEFSGEWSVNSQENRLAAVMVDQIKLAPTETTFLPFPSDTRALAVCKAMYEEPQLHIDLEGICSRSGISQRTLGRILKNETKMSFLQWKQRLLIMASIERLAEGQAITRIALDLGYSTVSAYTYMFRRLIGVTPREYCNRDL